MKANLLILLAVLGVGHSPGLAASPDSADQRLTATDAKALALKAHAEAAAMVRLPSFFYRVTAGNGVVDSMRDRAECSVEGLKEALDGRVAEPDSLQWGVTLAWTERQAVWSTADREGPRWPEESKESRQDCVWTKDLSFERSATTGQLAYFIFTRTADQLWQMRLLEFAYFRVTPHRFWWANSQHRSDSLSWVPPEDSTYRSIAAEPFDDELCDVVESPSRGERLWIGRVSGRLRGVLVSLYRGRVKDLFYQSDRLQEIAGRSFATQEEYFEWNSGNSISAQQKLDMTRAWNEFHFDSSFGPKELIRFRDYRQVAPDVWIPFREDRAVAYRAEKDSERRRYIHLWVTVEEARTGVDLAKTVELLQPKEGEQIQDQRSGVVINYKFQHDRTEAELRELIDAQRRKQDADEEFMKNLLAPIEAFVGQPAPALTAGEWVGGAPPNLAGRPYLLHFWTTSCGSCKNDFPLLKKLAANGFPIIGVHPAGASVEEVGKVIDDQQLGYPTYLAPGKTAGDERTIGGYPVGFFPYCILVDRAGRVAGHGFLRAELIAKLRSLVETK